MKLHHVSLKRERKSCKIPRVIMSELYFSLIWLGVNWLSHTIYMSLIIRQLYLKLSWLVMLTCHVWSSQSMYFHVFCLLNHELVSFVCGDKSVLTFSIQEHPFRKHSICLVIPIVLLRIHACFLPFFIKWVLQTMLYVSYHRTTILKTSYS